MALNIKIAIEIENVGFEFSTIFDPKLYWKRVYCIVTVVVVVFVVVAITLMRQCMSLGLF